MNFAAQGDDAICVFVTEPTGPAQPASVLFADTQFTNFFVAQHQPYVVVKRVTQSEPHQRTQRLVTETDWQELMKPLPVQFANVDTEFAAAVAYAFPQHHAFTKHSVGKTQTVALLVKDLDTPFDALLNGQLGVFEVVTQHRFNQGPECARKLSKPRYGNRRF